MDKLVTPFRAWGFDTFLSTYDKINYQVRIWATTCGTGLNFFYPKSKGCLSVVGTYVRKHTQEHIANK